MALAVRDLEVLTNTRALLVEMILLLVVIDTETEVAVHTDTIDTMAAHLEEIMDSMNAEEARVDLEAEALEDTVITIESMLVEEPEIAQEIDMTEVLAGIVDPDFIRVFK